MIKQKSIKTILIILLTTIAASNSHAYISHDYKAYIGIGLLRSWQWNKASETQFVGFNNPISVQVGQYAPYLDAGSFVLGYNLKNIGLEIGYERFKNIYEPAFDAPFTSASTVYARQSGDNIFADVILYHSICNNFVVKAHIGAGFLTTKFKVYANVSAPGAGGGAGNSRDVQQIPVFRGERWGYRAGFGLQWNFARRWSTEFNYVFQNGNQLVDYLQTMRIGINYYVFCF